MEEDFTKPLKADDLKNMSDDELEKYHSENNIRAEEGFKDYFAKMLFKMQSFGIDIEDYVSQMSAEAERRWLICLDCPSLKRFDRCKECGCFMRLKTKVATSKCPLDKWEIFSPDVKRMKRTNG